MEGLPEASVILREPVSPHDARGNPVHLAGPHRLLDRPDIDHGPAVRQVGVLGDHSVVQAFGVSHLLGRESASGSVRFHIVQNLADGEGCPVCPLISG